VGSLFCRRVGKQERERRFFGRVSFPSLEERKEHLPCTLHFAPHSPLLHTKDSFYYCIRKSSYCCFTMSDVGDNNYVRYIYRGEEDEDIPDDVTHVTMREDVTVVRREAFYRHRNIVEVICHDKVEKIEQQAFIDCPSLRRVIMLGVTIVEEAALCFCEALTDVECEKLEIIETSAFYDCKSLVSINLPSAEVVEETAFGCCEALTDVKFGSKLKRIEGTAFLNCPSLGRIAIPLKDGMFDHDNALTGCENLNNVDLVEGVMCNDKFLVCYLLISWPRLHHKPLLIF